MTLRGIKTTREELSRPLRQRACKKKSLISLLVKPENYPLLVRSGVDYVSHTTSNGVFSATFPVTSAGLVNIEVQFAEQQIHSQYLQLIPGMAEPLQSKFACQIIVPASAVIPNLRI